LPHAFRIRPREPGDDAALVDIERRAVELFRPYYPKIADDPFASVEAMAALLAGNETHDPRSGTAAPARTLMCRQSAASSPAPDTVSQQLGPMMGIVHAA